MVFSGGLVLEKYWFSIVYIAVCIGLLNWYWWPLFSFQSSNLKKYCKIVLPAFARILANKLGS